MRPFRYNTLICVESCSIPFTFAESLLVFGPSSHVLNELPILQCVHAFVIIARWRVLPSRDVYCFITSRHPSNVRRLQNEWALKKYNQHDLAIGKFLQASESTAASKDGRAPVSYCLVGTLTYQYSATSGQTEPIADDAGFLLDFLWLLCIEINQHSFQCKTQQALS